MSLWPLCPKTDPSFECGNAVTGLAGTVLRTILRPDYDINDLAASLSATVLVIPSRTFHPASEANTGSYVVVARQPLTLGLRTFTPPPLGFILSTNQAGINPKFAQVLAPAWSSRHKGCHGLNSLGLGKLL